MPPAPKVAASPLCRTSTLTPRALLLPLGPRLVYHCSASPARPPRLPSSRRRLPHDMDWGIFGQAKDYLLRGVQAPRPLPLRPPALGSSPPPSPSFTPPHALPPPSPQRLRESADKFDKAQILSKISKANKNVYEASEWRAPGMPGRPKSLGRSLSTRSMAAVLSAAPAAAPAEASTQLARLAPACLPATIHEASEEGSTGDGVRRQVRRDAMPPIH